MADNDAALAPESESVRRRVRAVVIQAAEAALCVTSEEFAEMASSQGGLRFDSPQAEAIVARAEDLLGAGDLAEVADLDTGVAATVDTLTELLYAKLAEREGVLF